MNTLDTILVTGANGQLGHEIRTLSHLYPNHRWIFAGSKDLDITSEQDVKNFFKEHNPKIIYNCAAYTKVDLAESESEQANAVNAQGVSHLIDAMDDACTLIHYSTDYVYQSSGEPLDESTVTNPVNIYAASKLAGDQIVLDSNKRCIVIRTSWVYSSFGNNFVKTMLRLADTLDKIKVVDDQIGSPTYAADLAEASIQIASKLVKLDNQSPIFRKVYHYANQGQVSWHDFAKEIFQLGDKQIDLSPIPTLDYPTPAKRPSWSVLDCSLASKTFDVVIKDWKDSLTNCIQKIQND